MTSPPVTAWTPSSFHLLATTRAGCYLYLLPEIPLYRVFRGTSRGAFHQAFCQWFSLTNFISYWNPCIWLAESKFVSEKHWQNAWWNAPQEYPYPLFKDVIAILRFECILYRSLLSGKEIFAFLFRYCSYHFRESQSGKPALTGGLHPNAHFSFPGTLGQVRPEPPLECHCTVSLLFFTRIVFGRRILH